MVMNAWLSKSPILLGVFFEKDFNGQKYALIILRDVHSVAGENSCAAGSASIRVATELGERVEEFTLAQPQKFFLKKFDLHTQESATDERHRISKASEKIEGPQKGVSRMSKNMLRNVTLLAGGVIAAAVAALMISNKSVGEKEVSFALSSPVEVTNLPAVSGLTSTSVRKAPHNVMEEIVAEADLAPSVVPSAKMRAEMQGLVAMGGASQARSLAAPSADLHRLAQGYVSQAPEGLMASPMMDNMIDLMPSVSPDNDMFEGEDINPVKVTSEDPVSTFSVDVDTASYAFIRRQINWGDMPSPEQIRIEEMVNYFTYDYAAPEKGAQHPLGTAVSVFESPWNADRDIVRIGIQGMMPEIEDRPDLDLVFLIDTSGSMNSKDKIGLLQKSLIMAMGSMRPTDRIGIVTYAGSSGVKMQTTEMDEMGKAKVLAALASLRTGGSTAGASGLRDAYSLLNAEKNGERIGRVILATDGDFNVGMSDTEEMKKFIAKQRDSGNYLTVLGFGQGNYNDALMQALAQNGNGQAAYIDSLSEANKVLVDQMAGAMFPIANDVKIQVEWNPAMVSEYRLIGYETRALAREDFNNDKVDAGEIGAGHQVTALYEITPVDANTPTVDPLRYSQIPEATSIANGELGFLKIRYKNPGETQSALIETSILNLENTPDSDAKFAAAIAGFAQLMKDDKYLGAWGWEEAIDLAQSARGEDPFGYRTEAISLIRLGKTLALSAGQ
jgi:Ca-activated chloride channel family protein